MYRKLAKMLIKRYKRNKPKKGVENYFDGF